MFSEWSRCHVFLCDCGRHLCFLADPKLVPIIYKDRPELDFGHLGEIYLTGVMGISPGQELKAHLASSHATMDMFRKHFLKRESLADRIHVAQTVLRENIDKLLLLGLDANDSPPPSSEWNRRGLLELTCDMVFKATATSVVGETLANDECLQDFMTFDSKFPLLFANAPAFLTAKARQARENLVQVFASDQYLQSSSKLPFAHERDSIIKAPGTDYSKLSRQSHARTDLSQLWVSVANSMPGVFWYVKYIKVGSIYGMPTKNETHYGTHAYTFIAFYTDSRTGQFITC